MERNIIFSPPDVTEEEVEEVKSALLSGWITTGPRTKELEKMMAEYSGTSRFVCLNSATASMEMVYHLFGIGEGDEVITTAYTYTATASAICHVGAKPVIVDILGDKAKDSESPYEPDYDAIEKAVTPNTKAIIAVDVAGVMCDYDRIREIAKRHADIFMPSDNKYQKALGRILVMADSAHGFGAERDGKMSGQAADFTTFSFHAVKNLTTAEGGGITWIGLDGFDDDEVYTNFSLLSLHGQSKDALEKTKLGSWEYDILFPGYKCNMTDVHAALGLVQMKRYPELLARRKEIIGMYDEGLEKINQVLGKNGYLRALRHYFDDRTSSGHLYLMRVGDISHEMRSEIITKMAERGVPTNVHYKPLPLLTAYKNMGFSIDDYPEAYKYYKNEITLPLHTMLSDDDISFILGELEEVMKEVQ